MNRVALLMSLCVALPPLAHGASLARAENVMVTESGTEPGVSGEHCKGFSLSPRKAASFLNRSAIVTQREVHDFYDVAPCWIRGTALFHGYTAQWEIRAAGTGSITLFDGEHFPIVDESQRNAPK